MRRIANLNDVLSGALLIVVGILALFFTRQLRIGTTTAMGPGYFPNFLSWTLIAFGVATLSLGFFRTGEPFQRWKGRPIVFVLGSIAFFGLTVGTLGFVIALFGTVLVACAAHRGTRISEALMLAAAMSAFGSIVFVMGLGLSIPLWPPVF